MAAMAARELWSIRVVCVPPNFWLLVLNDLGGIWNLLFGINVDSSDDIGELVFLGGVRPRVPAPPIGMKPQGVSGPRMDLVSEEDRS